MTDYKEMANGKREIPMSSCPSYIEDQLYSSASVPGTDQRRDENEVFHEMMRDIDERTAKIKKPAPKRRKALPTVYDKIQLIRERFGRDIKFVHVPVDTEGVFLYGGETWRVNEPQYQATSSKDGEQVYGMDTVICASGLLGLYFFDMNYEQIMPQKIM